MNLLIAAVILLCLGVSEYRDLEFAQNIGQRLALMAMVALLVPGVAIFQTVVLTHRCRSQVVDEDARQRMLNRLSACHSAVWLAASLVIVWELRWPDIVRVNWECDWLLLDEFLILAPILGSLVMSWAIFYDVQRVLGERASNDVSEKHAIAAKATTQRWFAGWRLPQRVHFVGLRFRVYVLMSLIPILATLMVRDVANFAESLPAFWRDGLLMLGGLLVLAFFPLLMLLAWKSHAVEDHGLRLRLLACCRRLKLGVWEIRVWNTGHQIMNAVVAGLVPGLRVIVVSDLMVRQFPRRELLAVVRHEAGHIRLCHVPIRMFCLLLPMVVAALDQVYGSHIANRLLAIADAQQLSRVSCLAIGVVAYGTYLIPVLAWLSHRMEFEADWFAVQSERGLATATTFDKPDDEYDGMTLAIARLAANSPGQLDRATLMHPSLRRRMHATARMAQEPRLERHELDTNLQRRAWLVYGMAMLIGLMFLASYLA